MKKLLKVMITVSIALFISASVFAGGKQESAPAGGNAEAAQTEGKATPSIEKPAPGFVDPDIDTKMMDTSKYKTEGPWTIGFSNASVSNSWRVSFVEHIRYGIDQAKAAGLVEEYYETNANDDPMKQIADIEDLMTRGVDLLIVSAATSEALTPAVEKVMDQGIPVVTVDRNISSDKYVSFVECTATQMGKLQAEWLVAELGGKGKIIALPGLAGATAAEDRLTAAKKVFDKFPDIEILDVQYTSWSPVEGKRITQTLIQRFPEIDGVWADSGLQGSGAVEAFLEAGLEVPPITGEDFNRFLKMWKKNDLSSVGVTFSVRIGYKAVEVALDILRGEKVPHRAIVPNLVITEENLDDYLRMDLPDDYWAESMPEVTERLFPQ